MHYKQSAVNICTSIITTVVILSIYSPLLTTSGMAAEPSQKSSGSARQIEVNRKLESTVAMLKHDIESISSNIQRIQQQNIVMGLKLKALVSNTDKSGELTPTPNLSTSKFENKENISLGENNDNTNDDLVFFDNLKSEFSQEPYDSIWASEMDASLSNTLNRLEVLGSNTVTLLSQDCRTNTCLVEFTHDSNIDTSLLSSLIAVKGMSRVILKHETENGESKTTAIYKR